MTTALILTAEQSAHQAKMDERFRKEFEDEAGYAAKGFTLETFVAMRRVDEGVDELQPTALSAAADDQPVPWLTSELGEPAIV